MAASGKDFDHRRFAVGLARGLAGALLFALPMFLTMEMWELGFYIDRARLFLLLLVNVPLLVLLAHRIGFERTTTLREAIRDASIAYFLGMVCSGLILLAIGVLRSDQSLNEIVGMIAIQSVPASIGALLGRSQLGGPAVGDEADEDEGAEAEAETSYAGELFMMAVGALFLCLNVAPTEEMILLSYKMTPWHAIAVIVASIVLMHGFVYALSFMGGHVVEEGTPGWHALVRFTLPGYLIALAISLYCLWTFHRLDGIAMTQVMMTVVVLSLPGAIGAAAARLIL
ncbi:TIGR02587 family membrane protein [Mycoplana sp. MJR14]|uniref:TIGR02587 family membrane protein n=1 Tax=Mycoplana sp. MJR14 TaxID=3032583 RepID=UPI0011D0B0E4|nr:TIGR02587 family membrane protein [Mycoplana sp. MJR14]MDF1632535.1 TIGR02587 family membrane protein [Mycoplana sp. MJR14]